MTLGAVVLASASETRAAMLRRAGLAVDVLRPRVDEAEIKRSLRAEGGGAAEISEALAERKAASVSRRAPGRLVVGADQILVCDGEMFDKPADRGEAKVQLHALAGRWHELVSCVCAVRDEQRLWHHVDRARLHVRPLSDAFIDAYLQVAGDGALDGPGAYRVEGPGAHLFSRIEGDHFTILGLPLLPLLEFLRLHGAVRS